MIDNPLPQQNIPAWVMIAIFFGVVLFLFVIPPPYSTLLLVTSVVGSAGYGLYTNREQINFPVGWRWLTDVLASPWTRLLALVVTGGLMIAATHIFRLPPYLTSTAAARLLLAGTVAAGFIGWRADPRALHFADTVRTVAQVRVRRLEFGLGLALLAVLVYLHIPDAIYTLSAYGQLALFVAGCALIVRGLSGKAQDAVSASDEYAILRWEWVLLIVIMTVALMLRVYSLNTILNQTIDEIHSITAVNDLNRNPDTLIMTPHSLVTAFSWLYPLAQHTSVEVFGADWASLRLISGIVGTLNVIALWWLARILFDRHTAWVTALIFATLPVHVHFSRIGINNIVDPLVGTLTVAFLARGYRDGRLSDFVLSGLSLGLTQYFYEGGRLLFPVLMLIWAGWLWLNRLRLRRQEKRPAEKGLSTHWSALWLTALLTAAPFYLTMFFRGLPFAPRLVATTDGAEVGMREALSNGDYAQALQLYLERLEQTLRVFVQLPDGGWFYAGDTSLLLNVLIPFFMLGLSFILWRSLRSPATLVLLLWLLGTAMGTALLRNGENTWYPRFVIILPVMALIAAVGLRYTLHMITKLLVELITNVDSAVPTRLQRAVMLLPSVLMAGFMVFITLMHITYYFHVHVPFYHDFFQPQRSANDMIYRVAAVPDHTDVHIISELAVWETRVNNILSFKGRDESDLTWESMHPEAFTPLYVLDMPMHRNQAIFVSPNEEADRVHTILSRAFPDVEPQYNPDIHLPPQGQLALYYIPARKDPSIVPVNLPPTKTMLRNSEMPPRPPTETLFRAAAVIVISLFTWTLWQEQRAVMWRIATVGLVLWCAYLLRPAHDEDVPLAVLTFAGALFCLWMASRQQPRSTDDVPAGVVLQLRPRYFTSRWIAGASIAFLSLLTVINLSNSAHVPAWLQLILFVLGVVLLVPGIAYPYPGRRLSAGGLYLIAMMLILMLSFFLRITELDMIHRHVDEIASIDSMVEYWDKPTLQLLRPFAGVARFTRIYMVLQSYTVEMLGASLTGLRFISALFGTVTVAAMYFLGRELFNRRLGLIAALFLATFPPHLHFSRIGLNNVVDPLFGVLALAFLVRALKRASRHDPRLLDFALAGAMLGLTQYFYEGGRLLYPPLALIVVLLYARKLSVRAWVTLIGAFMMIAAPVYITLIAGDYSLIPRMEGAGRGGDYWSELLQEGPRELLTGFVEEMLLPVGHFLNLADRSGFYGGYTSLLLSVTLPFFLLGFGAMVLQLRRRHHLLILAWLAATVIGNTLLRNPVETARYVVTFPAIALVFAIGVQTAVHLVDGLSPLADSATRIPHRRYALVATSITVFIAVWQAGYYFNTHIDDYLQQDHTTAVDDVYFRAVNLPSNTHVYLITDEIVYGRELYLMLRFAGRRNSNIFMTPHLPVQVVKEFVDDRIPGRRYAYFVAPYDSHTQRFLEDYGGWVARSTSPYDLPASMNYIMYYRSSEG